MKKTKIICTLGPASATKEKLTQMYEAGMNVARVNTSFADKDKLVELIKVIEDLNTDVKFPVPILLDMHGTEMRLGDVGDPIVIDEGELFEIRYGEKPNTRHKGASLNIDIFKALKKGMNIFVDDRSVELEVEEIGKNFAVCKAKTPGVIKSRKSVNIPDMELDLSEVTDRDYEFIKFAIKSGIEVITLSFVRHKEELAKLRKMVEDMKSHALIIAKIEDATGVKNIDEIIENSDGVMIARGDLGAEIPLEEVPIVQRRIIEKCKEKGKIVIVATQMMESMIENPSPTRAEVSDVATAVSQKADLVMLSGETSVGKYPVRCVEAMSKICERIEKEEKFIVPMRAKENDGRNLREEITVSASLLARNIGAKAILVFTKSGRLARLTSKQRPTTPIFAFTQYEDVRHKLAMSRGVYSYKIKLLEKGYQNTENAVELLKGESYVKAGDKVVIISDIFKGQKDSQVIEVKEVQ